MIVTRGKVIRKRKPRVVLQRQPQRPPFNVQSVSSAQPGLKIEQEKLKPLLNVPIIQQKAVDNSQAEKARRWYARKRVDAVRNTVRIPARYIQKKAFEEYLPTKVLGVYENGNESKDPVIKINKQRERSNEFIKRARDARYEGLLLKWQTDNPGQEIPDEVKVQSNKKAKKEYPNIPSAPPTREGSPSDYLEDLAKYNAAQQKRQEEHVKEALRAHRAASRQASRVQPPPEEEEYLPSTSLEEEIARGEAEKLYPAIQENRPSKLAYHAKTIAANELSNLSKLALSVGSNYIADAILNRANWSMDDYQTYDRMQQDYPSYLYGFGYIVR